MIVPSFDRPGWWWAVPRKPVPGETVEPRPRCIVFVRAAVRLGLVEESGTAEFTTVEDWIPIRRIVPPTKEETDAIVEEALGSRPPPRLVPRRGLATLEETVRTRGERRAAPVPNARPEVSVRAHPKDAPADPSAPDVARGPEESKDENRRRGTWKDDGDPDWLGGE